MHRALPEAAAAGLIPRGAVQLRCSPEEAVRVYTLPMCAAPPPHNTAPATPPMATPGPGMPCEAPVGHKALEAPAAAPAELAGGPASCTCACRCGDVQAGALVTQPADVK